MEKSAQPGEGGGGVHAHPPSLPYIYHRVQICDVRTLQLRGQVLPSYFYSTPICTLWERVQYAEKPLRRQQSLLKERITLPRV